ncbi:autotransporter outer membrane beta-barrel domain-containing protein, partial [Imbroritus primus]
NTSTITGIDGGTGTNTLTFDNIQHTGGSDLTNWNTINLNNNTNLNLNSNLALAGPAGASQALNIDLTSTLTATGQRSITGSGPLTVTNAGRIDLSGTTPATGDRLVIGGDYVGNNGRITLDSMMGATGSPTDRVLVNGNASGTTTLHINNIGGSGAYTGFRNTDGISIVQVAGTATPGSFALAGGYVAAGPYQYVLRAFDPSKAAAGERDALLGGAGGFYDFRLQSPYSALLPVPQIAAYQSTMPGMVMMGGQLLDTMHNRLGEIRHMVGKNMTWSNELFVRAKGSELKFDGDKGPDFRHNNVFIQMGATPLRHIDANGGEWHGGVGLAYSDSSIKVPSTQSRAEITMPTVSGMLSYLHPSGWYVDSVLQASAIRAKFKTAARGDTGKTSGYGFGASIEGGYNIQLPANLRIEPQAQLQYQYQHLKGFTDVDQIEVGKLGGSSLIGRIGARLMLDRSDEASRTGTPYVEANLIRQLAGSSNVVHAAGVDFAGDKVGTMAQYGLGVNVQWDKNVAMYLQARYTQSLGSRGYSGWGGTVGVRANF